MATRRLKPLTKVSLAISAEAEEPVVELFSRIFDTPASVYADTEKHTTVVTVFVPALTPAHRRAVAEGLRVLRECGVDLGHASLRTRKLKAEDWSESWKRHFKPIHISRRLLVRASWHRDSGRDGQATVILDPGLSFGTGQHPTTEFCLRELVRARKASTKQSLLDVGTGSGILAIAAVKLGYGPVSAFDFDPDAVRVAKENATVNRVKIELGRRDLTKLPLQSSRRYDVVCANLIYDLLIAERARILRRLQPAGTLVLAGILNEQFPAVQRAYEEAGMVLQRKKSSREWTSGSFVRRTDRISSSNRGR